MKKGTFVFEKNSLRSAGFLVSAKSKMGRSQMGLAPRKMQEIIITDLWDGRDTHFGSLENLSELSSDKSVFIKYINEEINHVKEGINKVTLIPSQKRAITLHEKNKNKSKAANEVIQTLAKDLMFYEDLCDKVNSRHGPSNNHSYNYDYKKQA